MVYKSLSVNNATSAISKDASLEVEIGRKSLFGSRSTDCIMASRATMQSFVMLASAILMADESSSLSMCCWRRVRRLVAWEHSRLDMSLSPMIVFKNIMSLRPSYSLCWGFAWWGRSLWFVGVVSIANQK
eukprot:scaffold17664_cov94-Skeletonema_dohrnii-CCMP3373.AAC.1